MAIQLSPGVAVSEVDLTTVVPSVLTTSGATAGYFSWGPANKIVLITNEIQLSATFGQPDSNSAINFLTAASFLAYGNNLKVVRTIGSNCHNAQANTTGVGVQVGNSDVFQYTLLNQNNNNAYGAFMARYAGVLGNSLAVAVCANTSNFSTWQYANYFPSAPGTSAYAQNAGTTNDEMHIIVLDAGGLFTGSIGAVLETFPYVSKAYDAVNLNSGSSNYYKQVIFNSSKYIYAVDPIQYSITANTSALGAWGTTTSNGTSFISNVSNTYLPLVNGSDDVGTDAQVTQGYSFFTNKDIIDISLVLTNGADTTIQQYVIDNISTARADCIAFISPPYNSVVNQAGNEATNITTWLTALARTNSYTVADSGWKYMFDKYNNVYRWIPLNGDIAGLCVYTDSVNDPWWSPAGYNRGAIKNAIKLAWNPGQTYRDVLYSAGINPVVAFPGQGIILYGDKTLQAKPSAFDRINVRRLFITIEKAIAKAAKYSLFEFNDAFTQSQFVALVTPFLRDIQGRRGITAFRVVCDSTNNTPAIVDANKFVGDIYIQPARSINFIQLNFVAVGTGVDFNTIVGAA